MYLSAGSWSCASALQAHWRAGHKEDCNPKQSPRQAEADKTQRLLETAVLKPEQVGSQLSVAELIEFFSRCVGEESEEGCGERRRLYCNLSRWSVGYVWLILTLNACQRGVGKALG
jgi:hypothetical protein